MTPAEMQRAQLARLLKDPAKPAFVPEAPKPKTVRPAREMMKNVQGSSAGAGSGEFHVYKANRRREYERLKIMEEEVEKETATQEFERKKREREEAAEAKTAKNRAKRQKKKQAKAKGPAAKDKDEPSAAAAAGGSDRPVKKRRLVNGEEVVFRSAADASDSEGDDDGPDPALADGVADVQPAPAQPVSVAETAKITILEDD
ncbi:DUF1168-domain-containing protein [Auricularia subglabra TFB-10046 SS5]|nr:DUF1168-domain-containing protein [Auricularia subglabra TFB-10046 SS5]